MKFPRIDTHDLNGQRLILPQDLPGELNLLLIAYQQWQQRQVDTWMPTATQFAETNPAFHVFEIPVIRRLGRVGQFFVDQGMRGGIPGSDNRARVLTVYLDKEAFKRQLGIFTEDDIAVLLVRPDGEVVWRERGSWSPDKEAWLQDALRELAPEFQDAA